jgi:glycosyltransferase involved in cell wall biosynthesis
MLPLHVLSTLNCFPDTAEADPPDLPVATMISVCMAVYKGADFVEAQLHSILKQLGNDDEVVIVDDASTDNTVDLISNIVDARIRLLTSAHNRGALRSFEKALEEARGDYIFFSDQDDLWLPGKVAIMLEEFRKSGALAIVSDAIVVKHDGTTLHESYFAWRGSGPGVVRNFRKNAFLGCCMAIRRECKAFLLPFPPLTYMHDQWAGLACSIVGQVRFLPQPLLAYRRHRDTLTQMHRSPWWWILHRRAKLVLSLLLALPRLVAWRIRRPAA